MEETAEKHPKVVLIDDDQIWANLLTHKLTTDDISWKYFSEGEKGIQFFEDGGRADIILLDISMPGLDGFEVLKRIKTNPAASDIPVVMMSNYAQEKDIEWGKKLGAKKFMDKVSTVPGDVVDIVSEFALKS